jgi:hypothetical protein
MPPRSGGSFRPAKNGGGTGEVFALRLSGMTMKLNTRDARRCSFPLFLATLTLSTNELRDIKDPVPIPDPWRWALWGVLLLLAAAGILLWRWLRKSNPVPVPAPRRIPPHEKARKTLLHALDLIDEPRPFCIAVSDALRLYLEERFELRAPERTTEEFLSELQASPVLTLEQKGSLADFLGRCDLVKFARYEPREPELRALYDSALRLISETEPREVIVPDATVSTPAS